MPSYQKKIPVPGKSASELYEKVSTSVDKFLNNYSGQLGQFDIEKFPADQKVKIKSKFLTAELSCSDGCFELDGSISLMAYPFKSKIDEGIEKWINKHFSNQSPS